VHRRSSSLNESGLQEKTVDPRWQSLYADCRSDLYRVAAYLIGSAEAEEVVQEAFERGMHERNFFEDIGDPLAWLRRVTLRLAISRLRRRAVLERILPLAAARAPAQPDPDLHDALRRLPPTQRGALVLRYYFGADYSEIARTLGLTEKSVGSILTRARAALRRELA